MKSFLQFFFLFILSTNLVAQSEIPIGAWKSYLPYKQGPNVTQSSEKIIYGTPWSIMSIDKSDQSVEFLSTVEGLTEVGVQHLTYDKVNEQLIVAYDNSGIDIVKGSQITPIFGIRDNGSFQNKKIYDIYAEDGQFAYLATGFGIVQLNLRTYNFGFTSVTPFDVNAITSLDNFLFAATEDGLYYFDLESNQIPNDFGNWKLLEIPNGLPVVYNAIHVASINGSIYLVADNEVYISSSNLQFELAFENQDGDFSPHFIEPITNGWMLGMRSESVRSKLIYFSADNEILGEDATCADRINGAIQDEQGRIWLGESFSDFRFLDQPLGSCNRLKYDSPQSHEASELAIKDNSLYVASGGVSDAYGYLDSRQGFYILEEGDWININEGNTSFLKENNLLNQFRILPHPLENKLYVGSFYRGLIEYDLETEEFALYDPSNSSLQAAIGDPDNTRISGLAFDADRNLWVANHGAGEPLSVYTAEGNWHSFSVNTDNRIAQVAIDNNGFIWAVVAGNSGGVLVYDTNGTIPDPTDDPLPRFFNSNNSELSTGLVNCLEMDLDGDIWVGTAAGPVIFECGGNVFESICVGSTRKVLQDSIAAILLQTENIKTIAVDGANRKWFGTTNGIFVQSSDGEDQIFHFTKDNSPLFDNSITDMTFNPESGEMFIATEKGILSYRTASTIGNKRRHSTDVYAYPNPVRADYQGPIAIKGLVRDANVKITDLNGQLVYETTALGGQAVWDGKDYTGRNVVSGVYLVFSSSTDSFNDPDSHVTKILMVR